MCSGNYPEILIFQEAAKFLRISKSKLEVLVAQGKVKPSIIPPVQGSRGQRRFLKSDLLELIRSWKQ